VVLDLLLLFDSDVIDSTGPDHRVVIQELAEQGGVSPVNFELVDPDVIHFFLLRVCQRHLLLLEVRLFSCKQVNFTY